MPEFDHAKELESLWTMPKRVPVETSILGFDLRLADGPSFVSQYREIFISEAYDFPFDGPSPLIIDGGANIGLALLWWLSRWPSARVIGFEPDPGIFETLLYNLRNYPRLDLRRAALSTPSLGKMFLSEGSDAGRLGHAKGVFGDRVMVSTVNLGEVLDSVGHVDLLKLDIEGAETQVLHDAENELVWVDRIFVEYHSFVGERQSLADLLSLLKDCGYRVHLSTPVHALRPFLTVPKQEGMDMQCDIWAWRDGDEDF